MDVLGASDNLPYQVAWSPGPVQPPVVAAVSGWSARWLACRVSPCLTVSIAVIMVIAILLTA